MNRDAELKMRALVNKTRVTTDDCKYGLEMFGSWFLATISGVPVCALIVGESGTGKSTLIEMLLSRFKSVRDEYGVKRIAIAIKVPEWPTPISLLEALLEALGDPRPEKGTRPAKMRRLVKAIKDQGVLFIFLDELQHFVDRNQDRVLYDAADCLKKILIETNISIVAAGLPYSRMVIDSNEQLTRRFVVPVPMQRYDWLNLESRGQFIGLLAGFEGALAAFDMPAISSEQMALRMYLASGGLVDHVAKILAHALNQAIDKGSKKVSMANLARARDVALWDTSSPFGNPFAPKYALDKELEEKIRLAKRINQPVARPAKKGRSRSRLTSIGM